MCDVLLQYDLEQMKVKIQKDYGKTYKELLEYVEIMKDWLKTQEHLPQITRDEIIRSYILMCKFSIERVKSKLDFYYSIRSKFPEYYKNTIPSKNPDIFELMDQVYFLLLPKLTTTLNRVLFIKITEQCNPETFDIERYVVVAFNNFEIMITEDIAYTYDVIFDLQHFNSALFAKLTPIFIKKILYLMQKVYSTRPYTLTTINMNPTLEYLCKKVIVPLLPAKLASRVFFSKNAEEFLNRFPNDVIPKDYGGNGISLKDLNGKFILQWVFQTSRHFWRVMTVMSIYIPNRSVLWFCAASPWSYFLLLPKLTTTLNRVLFLKITEQCNPETFDIERYVVVAFNNFEIMITEDIAYTYDVIFDLQHFNSALFAKLTPIFIKKILYLMQKVYSTRPYTLTTINMNPTLEYLCKKVIVPLLPAKLASRVFFSRNADEFLNRFPNDVIPKDYGGNGISLKDLNEKWKQKLLQYDSRFEQLENAKVNEDKRPEKLVNDEVLGFYGNFKKLDVD